MNNIKKLRAKNDIKQAELAKYLNVSRGTLSHWEQEKYDIDNKSLLKLADYFNVTIDYILGRIDNHAGYNDKERAPIQDETLNYTLLERSHIEKYRQLNLEGQRRVDEYTEDLVDSGKYKKCDSISDVAN
ncbi:MAG: helix-turn-helix domain-containing protein [Oscillospiraceae bacterium]|nr:helix-turn-helix domain-containing protein [Oscillospiraceae bacterium]